MRSPGHRSACRGSRPKGSELPMMNGIQPNKPMLTFVPSFPNGKVVKPVSQAGKVKERSLQYSRRFEIKVTYSYPITYKLRRTSVQASYKLYYIQFMMYFDDGGGGGDGGAVRTFEMNNQTHVTEFVFLGFSNHPNLQGLFFLIFLVIYLTTLLGNILIITATRASPALHTPMYYFLSGLSFLDICYTSTTIPVMLVNFFREKKTISYEGCLSQIFFLVTCAGSEGVLLAAMAYDRYVAICHPLQYPVLMSVKVCVCLVTGSWLCGLVNSMTHTVLAATLSLCGPNQISHFLCDIPLLLKLSCSDTSVNESVLHVASATIGLSPCLFTAVSYMLIISAILRIPSTQGRSKAFSTCASHLTVVVVFFGTANFNYDRPSEGYSLDMDILVSVLFCVMTPMLNPIIYSLRNKEIKGALWKLVGDHGTRVK
ncbi:olfactory receptor 5J3-like [Dasypus novemcinctus]|uniref:olfactory receptor 5J3-like n=1 Tax=Dasypus novemcinctus TaxID=9361 RepID=UPI0039C908E0